VREVEEQAVARPRPERVGVEPEVLGASRRVLAAALGEEDDGDAVADPCPADVIEEGRDELAGACLGRLGPEDLQPVRVDAEGAEAEEVLEGDPEVAAPGGVFGDEGGAEEDGISRGYTFFAEPSAGAGSSSATALLPLGVSHGVSSRPTVALSTAGSHFPSVSTVSVIVACPSCRCT
jgi:hypothetical protein